MELTPELVARVLKERNLPKGGLARAWGTRAAAVSEFLAGKRQLQIEELAPTISYLGLDQVPVVGRVSAGAKMIFFADTGAWERVPAPQNATENTVAVEIEGTSLGPLFERWLVFYDRVERPITRALIGKLCVVGLPEGEVLVKQVVASRTKGLFHLYSNTNDDKPILDQQIAWAARVKSIAPR
jgi:hypothetical protein